MGLTEVEGSPGAPWERPLAGSLDKLIVESERLSDNPLGDPSRRPLWVYRPPGVEVGEDRELPSVYVLQSYFNQLYGWTERKPFEPTPIERFDELFTACLLYTSPSPGDRTRSRMPSSA